MPKKTLRPTVIGGPAFLSFWRGDLEGTP
jgi:hypothetical protein